MQGRCGTSGRFPVSTGVPAIVSSIAARYRRCLPAAVWAAVCSDFVDFVVAKQPAEGAKRACPVSGLFEPEDPAPGGKGAAAQGGKVRAGPGQLPGGCTGDGCPKCSVVAMLVRALRSSLDTKVCFLCRGTVPLASAGGCRCH